MIGEGQKSDVSISALTAVDGPRTWHMLDRGVDFYHHKISHIAPDGRLVPSPLPDDANLIDVIDGRMIGSLKSSWEGHPAGALVAYSIPHLLAGKQPTIETVFVPNEHQAVEEVSASQSKLWVKYLDDVSGRLTALTRAPDGTWSSDAGRAPRQIDHSSQRDGAHCGHGVCDGRGHADAPDLVRGPADFRARGDPGASAAVRRLEHGR